MCKKNVSEPRNEFYRDIYDGRIYKKFVSSLPAEDRQSYVTLTFNADGASVFKSSTYSIWPIQLTLNEIPFRIRHDNPVVFGLWFGKDKPILSAFLEEFTRQMNVLSHSGIICKIGGMTKNIEVLTICACVDTVARAAMLCFIQFNGKYGCNWCLHPGVPVMHVKKKIQKYPILQENPKLRNINETLEHIDQSRNSIKPVFGVKGRTPLWDLKGFDIFRCVIPDYMHCFLLGIGKQLAHAWFEEKNKPYSLSNVNFATMDEYMKRFKVLSQITRLSRSLKERKKWKAREWENFILYFSLPLLHQFESFEKYSIHWSYFVEGMHLLLITEVSRSDIENADKIFKKFMAGVQDIYGAKAMTLNIHQLLHIVQSVIDFGLLWSHSCFGPESNNGKIVKKIKSAKGVINQICRSIMMSQSLIILKDKITDKESEVLNFAKYLDHRYYVSTSAKMPYARYFQRHKSHPDHLASLPMTLDNNEGYCKMVKDGDLYTCDAKRNRRSENSIAETVDGRIIRIFAFIIDQFENKEYVICKEWIVENVYAHGCSFLKKVVEKNEELVCVRTQDIFKICVLIKLTEHDIYIAKISNLHHF